MVSLWNSQISPISKISFLSYTYLHKLTLSYHIYIKLSLQPNFSGDTNQRSVLTTLKGGNTMLKYAVLCLIV